MISCGTQWCIRSDQSLTEGAPLFDQSIVQRVRAILQYRLHLQPQLLWISGLEIVLRY